MSGCVEELLLKLLEAQKQTLLETREFKEKNIEQLSKLIDFTVSLERERLATSLIEAGYILPYTYHVELSIAPAGTTETDYMYTPPGYVLWYWDFDKWNSLPWYVAEQWWMDSDAPATPIVTWNRVPDHYHFTMPGLIPVKLWIRATCTNNHPTETAYFCIRNNFGLMSLDVWKMVRTTYMDAVIEHILKQARAKVGIP